MLDIQEVPGRPAPEAYEAPCACVCYLDAADVIVCSLTGETTITGDEGNTSL